jgi:hypothetical protein
VKREPPGDHSFCRYAMPRSSAGPPHSRVASPPVVGLSVGAMPASTSVRADTFYDDVEPRTPAVPRPSPSMGRGTAGRRRSSVPNRAPRACPGRVSTFAQVAQARLAVTRNVERSPPAVPASRPLGTAKKWDTLGAGGTGRFRP